MGLLDGLLGNAKQVSTEQLQKELHQVLITDEEVAIGFQVIRDQFVFTNLRLILVDKQGMGLTGGKKTEYKTIPYKSIKYFSVETAGGAFDRDSELKIYLTNATISKKLKKGFDIIGLQRVLAHYILK